MKRILFVIPSLEVGGTISSLSSLVKHLKSKYEISILPLAFEGNLNVDFKDLIVKPNIFLHAYNCSLAKTHGAVRLITFFIKLLKRISKVLGINIKSKLYKDIASKYRSDYDIVIGFQEGEATVFASMFVAKVKVAWVHCDYSNYPKSDKELSLYTQFDKIVCVSQYTANIFKGIYPVLRSKVTYVYNLINYEYIISSSKDELEDALFLTDKFTILSVGRVSPVKRFSCIPGIAKKLVEKGCDFRWYILGPNFGDETYFSLLREIDNHSVQDYVFYLGNKYNPYPYFLKSNILVSLSYTEACPMIFNEAKALGLPIVTANFGSSYEFISNEVDGYIVPIENIADKLYDILSSTEFYNNIRGIVSKQVYSNQISFGIIDEILS